MWTIDINLEIQGGNTDIAKVQNKICTRQRR